MDVFAHYMTFNFEDGQMMRNEAGFFEIREESNKANVKQQVEDFTTKSQADVRERLREALTKNIQNEGGDDDDNDFEL